jgi:hypothetical protein
MTVWLMMTVKRRSRAEPRKGGGSETRKQSFQNSIWLNNRGMTITHPAGSYPRAERRHARKDKPLDDHQQGGEEQVRDREKRRRAATATLRPSWRSALARA